MEKKLMTPDLFMSPAKPMGIVHPKENLHRSKVIAQKKSTSVESVGKRIVDVAVDNLLMAESPDRGWGDFARPKSKQIGNAIDSLIKLTTPPSGPNPVQIDPESLVSSAKPVSHAKWAGSAYRNAPAPSDIPLPSFH